MISETVEEQPYKKISTGSI